MLALVLRFCAATCVPILALRHAADARATSNHLVRESSMRIPTLITALALGATAMAQSPLTTTFTSNNGQAGNMFDLVATNAAGVTIDFFDVNLDAGSWDLEVYKLTVPGPYLPSVSTPADWTLVGSTTGLVSNGPNVPTLLPISVCEFIPNGATQSFYVTVTNGTAINYTNGTTTGTLFASNGDLECYEGAGVAYPFASNFNPRVFNGNIYYNVGNNPGSCTTGFASKTTFGTGCYNAAGSFYEVMDAASMDLGGLAVTGTNSPSGINVTTGPGVINPIGGAAVMLSLGDDAQVDTGTVGGTLGLSVGSNCWVASGPGNSNAFAPVVATFLSNPDKALYAWTDLQPNAAGSGQVWYEESGTVAQITYDGVYGWGTTDPNTVQFVIDTATGDFTISFGALSINNPEDWLIGYSNGDLDPGASDLTAGSFLIPAADTVGLTLDSTVPYLGTIWSITLDNIDTQSPFAVFAFGDAAVNPGFDLGPIGGPGCSVYSNASLGFYFSGLIGSSSQFNVLLPSQPSLIGAMATLQGAASTSLNAIGFATSNGLSVVVGN